jgi:CRP-like cAMP-binding protein
VSNSALEARNRLLRALDPKDLALLRSTSRVSLNAGELLETSGARIEHCYFVEQGAISVRANSPGCRPVDVGLVGAEGMTGLPVVMNDDRSPNETYVQIAGSAYRVAADDLRNALAASTSLRGLLLRYAQWFLTQTIHTALANSTATIGERLARWVVMAHDRVGDCLPFTHELLARTLGVRRSGVTDALHILEGRGLIRATRGKITVLDRDGLIDSAGGSYGVPEAEYERLLGLNANLAEVAERRGHDQARFAVGSPPGVPSPVPGIAGEP